MAETIFPRPPDRDADPATPTGIPVNRQPMIPERSGGYATDSTAATAHTGGEVLQSAKDQSLHVAAETGHQVRGLYDRAVGEVAEQAGVQQKRIVNGLYALSDEAARMASAGGESGAMTPVVREAGHRFRQAGEWLERREPGDVVREVKEFARQHPGTFLIGAAVLGTLAGRLTKNLSDPDPDLHAPAPSGRTGSTADTAGDRGSL